MKTVAVITEFNPFHQGHEYFLREVRRLSNADNIIALMSGNIVQRGEPAVFDKFTRASFALYNGADLIIELPDAVSAGSAPDFAYGAVSITDKLNVVDELWFGSEHGSEILFDKVAEILTDEPEEFSDILRNELRNGSSFAKARSAALKAVLRSEEFNGDEINEFLSSPNNILGIEYCLALKKLGSNIKPRTITRKGCGYNETDLTKQFPSASAIRKRIYENLSLIRGCKNALDASFLDFVAEFKKYIPDNIANNFDISVLLKRSLFPDDFSLILRYKLLHETHESLCGYLDINEDLARRIKANEHLFKSYTQFAMLLKTKNQTYSHISRALAHILFDIKKEDRQKAFGLRYARVLGFRKASSVMGLIKKSSDITLAVKPSVQCREAYSNEVFSSNLYYSVLSHVTDLPYIHEFSREIIIL